MLSVSLGFYSFSSQGPALGWGNTKHKDTLDGEWIESRSEEKDLGVLGEVQCELAKCTCSLESKVSWVSLKAAWATG